MSHKRSHGSPLQAGVDGLTASRRWVPLVGMRGTYRAEAGEAQPDRSEATAAMLDWLVVGGGVHGTYLSNYLVRRLGVPIDQLRVLDPGIEPLHTWKRVTDNVGMSSLRSPAVHHLDLASLSLKRFSLSDADRSDLAVPPLLAPYGRPALLLFNRHSDDVVRRNRLDVIRILGSATSLELCDGGYEVGYEGGRLRSRRVLLALGLGDQPYWPAWARRLRGRGAEVHHVLDEGFERRTAGPWRSALVVGGGLSGAQVALAMARLRPGTVTLLARRRPETHLFDSEPSWQGQNFMRDFACESNPDLRRAIIDRERHRGSVTPEAASELDAAIRDGAMQLVVSATGPVVRAVRNRAADRPPAVRVTVGAATISSDLVLLATGFDRKRPGGAWLDRSIDELGLPTAACGYPIVRPSLEWRPGLYVTGPLAELELGPVARNIAGAHRAAARLDFYLNRAAAIGMPAAALQA